MKIIKIGFAILALLGVFTILAAFIGYLNDWLTAEVTRTVIACGGGTFVISIIAFLLIKDDDLDDEKGGGNEKV